MKQFITKIAIPIIEAWDFPALIFENGEPVVINGAMYKLLSWSDIHDSHFVAQIPEDGRLCGIVHRRKGAPRAVSLKCALYKLPPYSIVVCDNNPDLLLNLLLAAMAAHVKAYHQDFEFLVNGEDNWSFELSGNLQGYDARVISEWRSFRDIYSMLPGGWFKICKTPLRDLDMHVAGVVTVREKLTGIEPEIVRIIGERMVLEETVDHSSFILFSCRNEEDYPIDYISKNISRYEMPEDILLGRGILADLFPPSDRSGLFYEINKSYGSFSDFSFNHSFKLNDGGIREMKTVMRFIADSSGQIVSLEGQISDVTEHNTAQNALNEIKRPLQERLGNDLMENISPIGNEVSLYDVVDINDAQQLFAQTFGVGSAIVDLAGVPITQPISYSPAGEVCSLLNMTQDICGECYQRIAKMLSISGHNEVLHCKATGLMITTSPIKIGERIVAAWVLCQMLTNSDCGRFLSQTGKRYGIDTTMFEDMLKEVPAFSVAKFECSRSMLELVSEQVSMLATRSAQFFVQQDIANLEKGHKGRLGSHSNLLFECFSKLEACESPLELMETIASRLKFNRAYYYQAGASYSLRYEWFSKNRLPRELRLPPLNIFPHYTTQELEVYETSKIMESATKQYAVLSEARCMVHMPVINNGRLLGVLGLDECSGVRIFFEEDRRLLSLLMGMVAAAIKTGENAKSTTAIERCLNDITKTAM